MTSRTSSQTWQAALYSLMLACLFCLSACDGNGGSHGKHEPEPDPGLQGCADTASCPSNPPLSIGTDRPAQVQIPSNYDPNTRYPLMIALHGYGIDGAIAATYFGLDVRVDDKQLILVKPDGTANRDGTRFWNATPACCAKVAAAEDASGEDYTQIDDVAYIRSLIEEAAANYSIDTSRITLFGHSNGGFLTLRMVCEASDYVTAVISIAGSTFADASDCAPASTPVSVLLLHGTNDGTISYYGDEILGEAFPPAQETAARFADIAGCNTGSPTELDSVDVVSNIDGLETSVLDYPDCATGVSVQLWTIADGPHIPFPWAPGATDRFIDWLLERPHPQ